MDKSAEILFKSSKATYSKATSTVSCYQLSVFCLWHFDRDQFFTALGIEEFRSHESRNSFGKPWIKVFKNAE